MYMRNTPKLSVAAALALICSGAIAAQLRAQPENADRTEQSPVVHSMAELRPGRVVVLREGSVLTQTAGVLRTDDRGRWLFGIDMPNAQDKQLELILLPSSTLEEMQRIAESINDQRLGFEITGEVFVYQNRNYLLPTHAPHLVETPNANEPQHEQPADDEEKVPEDGGGADPVEDDSIESIMQRLEERSGPVARSSAGGDAAPKQPQGVSSAAAASTLREGMTLLDRRGHLTRGGQGEWMFVFDADAEGLADPPVRVLPCLLLQRMQEYARRESNIAPMLLSGRVFEYHGRRYVLPTLYRVPQMRTLLTP